MEIEIEFEYGPLKTRVVSEADEDYEQVLEDISEFIEENRSLFNSESPTSPADEVADRDEEPEPEETVPARFSEEEIGVEPEAEVEDENWSSLVEETGVSEERLQHMFAAGEEILPRILVGESLPDGSDNETMETAALLVLTIWEEYNDEQSMEVSNIKDCLRHSGLPHDNFTNIYQRSSFSTYFVRQEGDGSSQLSLTPPGKSRAYEFIESLAEEVDI